MWDFAENKGPEDYAEETLILYAGWKSVPEQSETLDSQDSTNTPDSQSTITGANTGDSVHIMVWVILLAAAILIQVKKCIKPSEILSGECWRG